MATRMERTQARDSTTNSLCRLLVRQTLTHPANFAATRQKSGICTEGDLAYNKGGTGGFWRGVEK